MSDFDLASASTPEDAVQAIMAAAHAHVGAMYLGALEEARRERDEARSQAVWGVHTWLVHSSLREGFLCCMPRGVLTAGGWRFGDMAKMADLQIFTTEAEALAAGRALPWWEVKA